MIFVAETCFSEKSDIAKVNARFCFALNIIRKLPF
jgi:hypothetical protein